MRNTNRGRLDFKPFWNQYRKSVAVLPSSHIPTERLADLRNQMHEFRNRRDPDDVDDDVPSGMCQCAALTPEKGIGRLNVLQGFFAHLWCVKTAWPVQAL